MKIIFYLIIVSLLLNSSNQARANMVPEGMVAIKKGCFMMGTEQVHDYLSFDQNTRERPNERERPVHKVCLDAFYLDIHELSQANWEKMNLPNNSLYKNPNIAVNQIKWKDANSYCKKSKKRLPTEAEWEYACRAVTETAWSFGHDKNQTFDYAFCGMNTWKSWKRYSQQVGLKKPNAFGLYDMHGNVWEWCHDYFFKGYYIQSPSKDPMGPTSGSLRALRGGSWRDKSHFTRSACRGRNDAVYRSASVGFRLVREMD